MQSASEVSSNGAVATLVITHIKNNPNPETRCSVKEGESSGGNPVRRIPQMVTFGQISHISGPKLAFKVISHFFGIISARKLKSTLKLYKTLSGGQFSNFALTITLMYCVGKILHASDPKLTF